jgi:solute carrier family 25 phosphate transporter 23/24/25/41
MSAQKQQAKKTPYGHLFTGGIAGAVSRTATSPLERLRILQQTASKEYLGKGTIGSFRHMAKIEGFRGFFKGNGATVAKIAPFSAFEFYFYALFKNNLYPGKERHELRNHQKLIAGGLTGACAQALVYPMDLIKTYLTVNIESGVKMGMVE